MVRLSEREYRTLRALAKALLVRAGRSASFTGAELWEADKMTLESGFDGDDEHWQEGSWHLSLTDAAPPSAPTVKNVEQETVRGLLSRKDAAARANVSMDAVNRAARSGKLPVAKKDGGAKGKMWFRPEDVDAWVAAREGGKEGLMSRADAAAYLGVLPSAVTMAVSLGKLRVAERTPGRGQMRVWFSLDDLDAYKETRRHRPGRPAAKPPKPAGEKKKPTKVPAPVAASEPVSEPKKPPEAAFDPDWRVAPGETLREAMEERNLTPTMLSWKSGIRLGALRAILDGTGRIDGRAAAGLEAALGVSAQTWLNLEEQYRKPLKEGAA